LGGGRICTSSQMRATSMSTCPSLPKGAPGESWRVDCPACGIHIEQVLWAAHGSRFTGETHGCPGRADRDSDPSSGSRGVARTIKHFKALQERPASVCAHAPEQWPHRGHEQQDPPHHLSRLRLPHGWCSSLHDSPLLRRTRATSLRYPHDIQKIQEPPFSSRTPGRGIAMPRHYCTWHLLHSLAFGRSSRRRCSNFEK